MSFLRRLAGGRVVAVSGFLGRFGSAFEAGLRASRTLCARALPVPARLARRSSRCASRSPATAPAREAPVRPAGVAADPPGARWPRRRPWRLASGT